MNAALRKARRTRWITAVLAATSAAFTALHGLIATLLHRAADRLADYSAAQVAKAVELLEDGAIHLLRNGIYLAVSSDGTQVHRTHVAGHCTCVAGLKTERAGHGCYHVAAARVLEAA